MTKEQVEAYFALKRQFDVVHAEMLERANTIVWRLCQSATYGQAAPEGLNPQISPIGVTAFFKAINSDVRFRFTFPIDLLYSEENFNLSFREMEKIWKAIR